MISSPLFLLLISLTSASVTALAMPLAMMLGRRMNVWDHPDDLGIHRISLNRSGGIAMALGLLVGVQLVWSQSLDMMANRLVVATIMGSGGIFLVGLLDDLHEISPSAKALGLLLSAVTSQLIAPHFGLSGFERFDFVIGIVTLFLGANAFNLWDGMDGLASGTAFISSLAFLLAFQIGERHLLSAQSALVAGSALGFWFFNRPPARIFMGDCGSLMLGFLLFAMGLRASSLGREYFIAAISFLSLPLLDTGLAVLRRLLARKDIFSGDRKHIYDVLYEKYCSVWKVNLIVYLLISTFCILGILALKVGPGMIVPIILLGWMAIAFWMQQWGMFEK